jgi:hypothetical protein
VVSPLVYIFAVAGGVVVVFFVASAGLTYRHASARSKRAEDLGEYVTKSGASSHTVGSEELLKKRERVMHITIGDLIRDSKVAAAASRGFRVAAQAAEGGSAPAGPADAPGREEHGEPHSESDPGDSQEGEG